MVRVQRLEREGEELTSDELAAFRKWFQEYDGAALDDKPTPRQLCKYFKYYPSDPSDKRDWTQCIFQDNRIWLTAPKDFNDPFDSVIRVTYPRSLPERKYLLTDFVKSRRLPVAEHQIEEWVNSGADILHMDKVCKELTYQMHRENVVFCMTEKKDDILMWAHYADHHTGFCLEFATDNPLFSRVRQVRYSGCHPREDLRGLLIARIRPLPLYLVTKATDWAYEKEWRLADPASGAGSQEYPPESLTGVIFGCQMDEKHKEQIIAWCGERKPRPALYEAKARRSEFGLDIIPLSY